MKCETQQELINSIPLIINNGVKCNFILIDKINYNEDKQKELEEKVEKYKQNGLRCRIMHMSDKYGDFVYISLFLIK